jgi:lipopolysaccharide export system permease protein
MSILFRYILREYLKMFVMCFAGLMTIYLVVDFFEKLRRFLRYDVQLWAMVEYFLLKIPFISFQVAPFAVLVATILTLGVLSRSHEITAMRSCGISLYRIASPLIGFGLIVSLALLSLSTVLIPLTNRQADYVVKTKIERKILPATFKADRPWVRVGTQALMNMDVVDPDGTTLRGIRLYQLGPEFRLTAVIDAKILRHGPEGWTLIDGVQRALLPDGEVTAEPFERRHIELSQTPEDFQIWLSREPEEMTLGALRNHVERLLKDGANVARLMTDYHGRIAVPFVSLVMVVVGIALSQRRSGVRGGGMAVGIGQALAIGILYWATHSVAIALGRTSVLEPVLAGWMANLLFLSFGFYLFLAVRH